MLNQVELASVDLNLLVLFDVVMHEQHVGRAASRMSVSPSAVSHGLGRLRAVLHDPLFLRTPKGVVPTSRALELAEPVSEILARVRNVIATGEPFAPARSSRQFVIGAPDAVAAVILPPLLAAVRVAAPGVGIGMLNLLPMTLVAALDAKEVDLAIAPLVDMPTRFTSRALYEEDFVIAMRVGHPFAKAPTLAAYCAHQHVMVSTTGDPHGYVDRVLAARGSTRRVALTVPSQVLALSVVAETDLLAALPRKLVAMHGPRFHVTSTEAPVRLDRTPICAITPSVAMRDAGVAWLVELLEATVPRDTATRGAAKKVRLRSSPRER